MDIKLARKVNVTAVDVIAQVGFPDDTRVDILAMLRLAADNDGLTPQLVSDELKGVIPGREGIAERLIDRLRVLRFIDEEGRLTPEGRRTVDEGLVFMPERGRYTLYVTSDDLIPARIVGIARAAEPDSGTHMRVENRAAQPPTRRAPPPELVRAKGNRFTSLVDGLTFELQELDNGAEEVPRPVMLLRVEWTIRANGSAVLIAQGQLGATKFERAIPAPAGVSHLQTLFDLAPGVKAGWSTSQGVLLTDVPEDAQERNSFRRDVLVKDAFLGDYGQFEPTTIRQVPLAPRSQSAADAWALWHLDRRITTYCHGETYSRACVEVQQLFPDHRITWPTQKQRADALAATPARSTPLYWYLQAPLDMPLPEVSA